MVSRWVADPRIASLIIAAATLVAYSGSPFNGFVADDHAVIADNPVVTGPGGVFDAFTERYRGLVYRPLTVWTFAVQARVHGLSAAAFHLVNVLLHAVMSLLVFRLARALGPVSTAAALFAGVLFAVHTIHTDAVSAVVGRADILAGALSVGAFLAWRRFVVGARVATLAAAGVLYVSALLSKESAAPLVLFAALWCFAGRAGPDDRPVWTDRAARARAIAGGLAAFVVPLAMVGIARLVLLGDAIRPAWQSYFASADAATTAWSLFAIAARYLWLLVVPYPLAPDYTWESLPFAAGPGDPFAAAGVLGVVGLLVATAVLIARRSGGARAAGLGLAWFLVFMLPATHLVPLMIPMAERLTYLASAGVCIALAVALDRLRATRPRIAVLAAGLYVAMLLGMTIERDRVWRDDLTLWSDAVATHPRSAISLMNLAGALVAGGRTAAAIASMQRAIEVAPSRWDFRVVLADLLHDVGRHADEAQVLVQGLRRSRPPAAAIERVCRALHETDDPSAGRLCGGSGDENGSVFR